MKAWTSGCAAVWVPGDHGLDRGALGQRFRLKQMVTADGGALRPGPSGPSDGVTLSAARPARGADVPAGPGGWPPDILQRAMYSGADEVHLSQASVADETPGRRSLLAALAPDEVRRADSFRSPRRRNAFLVGRAMLRTTLARTVGGDPRALRLAVGPHGKPFLQDEQDLRFNLSHSGDVVLCAIGCGREVGVDVERLKVDVDHRTLARRFFSSQENEQLASLPRHLQRAAFFAGWTRKEALVKAWGLGLSLPLDRFDVSMVPDRPPQLLAVREPGYDVGWSLHDLITGQGYTGALAVEGSATVLPVQRWQGSCGAT